MQRLGFNKLVLIEQLSPGGAAQQNTIAGSEQDFTLDSFSLRKTQKRSVSIFVCLSLLLPFPVSLLLTLSYNH